MWDQLPVVFHLFLGHEQTFGNCRKVSHGTNRAAATQIIGSVERVWAINFIRLLFSSGTSLRAVIRGCHCNWSFFVIYHHLFPAISNLEFFLLTRKWRPSLDGLLIKLYTMCCSMDTRPLAVFHLCGSRVCSTFLLRSVLLIQNDTPASVLLRVSSSSSGTRPPISKKALYMETTKCVDNIFLLYTLASQNPQNQYVTFVVTSSYRMSLSFISRPFGLCRGL